MSDDDILVRIDAARARQSELLKRYVVDEELDSLAWKLLVIARDEIAALRERVASLERDAGRDEEGGA